MAAPREARAPATARPRRRRPVWAGMGSVAMAAAVHRAPASDAETPHAVLAAVAVRCWGGTCFGIGGWCRLSASTPTRSDGENGGAGEGGAGGEGCGRTGAGQGERERAGRRAGTVGSRKRESAGEGYCASLLPAHGALLGGPCPCFASVFSPSRAPPLCGAYGALLGGAKHCHLRCLRCFARFARWSKAP